MRYTIRNARVVLPEGVVPRGSVTVVDGRIARVEAGGGHGASVGDELIDAEGLILAPGLVELHIHGCGGLGFESAEGNGPAGLARLATFLMRKGVTTFVPTIQCDLVSIGRLAAAIDGDARLAERVPGLYVEGPFVSRAKRGGILEETIREPDPAYLERVFEAAGSHLMLMTVAPELPGIERIVSRLTDAGVVPCWGHSECRLRDIPPAGGARRNVTHLFNAMSEISHREAGLAMLPFLDPEVYFELNGDGVHLNRETIRMCYGHLNRERLILISDAAVSAGREYGEYRYFGRTVVSGDSGVRYEDGTLIGSNCLMPEVVRRFAETTGAALHEAVRFATLNPCRLLGIDAVKGSIEVGKDADLVLFDDRFEAKRVFLSGDAF